MRLLKLSEYRRRFYEPGSAPCMETLRRNIQRIPGGRVELGRYYVDLDQNDRAQEHGKKLYDELDAMRKDPLLKGLL